MVQAYQKESATMTATAKSTREKTLQGKQQEYQQRAQALQAKGQAREQELTGSFEALVRDAINDVRTAEGYTMVFASGPASAMLSADKSLDITDKVLARMRTVASTRPATATPKPATTPAAPGAAAAAPAGATRPKPTDR
jgi:outer membrane protein